MYLCEISKIDVSSNNMRKMGHSTIYQISGKDKDRLLKESKKWLRKDFVPFQTNDSSKMTPFIDLTRQKDEVASVICKSRSMIFDKYGQPLHIIFIDICSINEIV